MNVELKAKYESYPKALGKYFLIPGALSTRLRQQILLVK
jgi:hypothetical protein